MGVLVGCWHLDAMHKSFNFCPFSQLRGGMHGHGAHGRGRGGGSIAHRSKSGRQHKVTEGASITSS